MTDWISFFDSDHPIYANARHRAVHARLVALGIGEYIRNPGMQILDYGCGEAFYAGRIAEHSGKLMLCEAAPQLRQSLKDRFGDNEKIATLGLWARDILVGEPATAVIVGRALRELGREEEALVLLKQVQSANPDHFATRRWTARLA